MIDALIILTLAGGLLLLSFYLANKLSRKPLRVAVKIFGIVIGFLVYVVLTALLNTDFQDSSQVGALYLFAVPMLLFIQRNKFKEK